MFSSTPQVSLIGSGSIDVGEFEAIFKLEIDTEAQNSGILIEDSMDRCRECKGTNTTRRRVVTYQVDCPRNGICFDVAIEHASGNVRPTASATRYSCHNNPQRRRLSGVAVSPRDYETRHEKAMLKWPNHMEQHQHF